MEWDEYIKAVQATFDLPLETAIPKLRDLTQVAPEFAPAHMQMGLRLWDNDRAAASESFRQVKKLFLDSGRDFPPPMKKSFQGLGVLDGQGNWTL